MHPDPTSVVSPDESAQTPALNMPAVLRHLVAAVKARPPVQSLITLEAPPADDDALRRLLEGAEAPVIVKQYLPDNGIRTFEDLKLRAGAEVLDPAHKPPLVRLSEAGRPAPPAAPPSAGRRPPAAPPARRRRSDGRRGRLV